MRPALFALLVFMTHCPLAALAADDAEPLAGVWRGPWYRGMTSGLMTLEIARGATGRIALTNLEAFGDSPAPLTRTQVHGDGLEFSAIGANGRDFTGQATKTADGRTLRGTARYEGFQFKFDLRRSE